jgi:hypothetical protein
MPTVRRPFALVLFVVMAFLPLGAWALQTVPLPGHWTDALTIDTLPDGSILVAQSSGLVDRLVPDGSSFREPEIWADLGDDGTSRLLGLAVDPDFLSSGYVYAALQTITDGQPVVRLVRWRDSGGLIVLNRVLVDHLPGGNDRTGGTLQIGPDGKLWLALGDGASPSEMGPNSLRGALLRYNTDGSIPEDNPSPPSPVWASGFRNPGGFAWQPGTNRLFTLDKGPPVTRGTNDRLDVLSKGADLGWPKVTARDRARGYNEAIIYCSSGHSWVPGGAVFLTDKDNGESLLFAGAGEGILYRLSLDPKTPSKINFYEELVNGALGPLVDVTLTKDKKPLLLSKERLYLLQF